MLNKNDLIAMFEKNSAVYSKKFLSQILIPTGRGGVYASRDYIHACAVISALKRFNVDPTMCQSKDDLKSLIPQAWNFRLKSYSPCLAYRYDELKPAQQEVLYTKDHYIHTEKENGCRGWFISTPQGQYLFSRNYSDVDCSLLEYWGNVNQQTSFPDIFAVDVEIKYEPQFDAAAALAEYGIETESKLEAMSGLLQTRPENAQTIQRKYKEQYGGDLITFRMIAPLYVKGKNYLNRTIGEGHKDYDDVIKYGQEHGLNLQAIKRCKGTKAEKEAFLNSILEVGGEGVVVHNTRAMYSTSENRDKDTYVKIKRSVSKDASNQGLGDTIEGFITGFKMSNEEAGDAGLIGSFEITINLMGLDGKLKPHVIAYVPNIPKEMKQACTVMDGEGNPTLAEEFYNLVVEVDGQAISAKSRRLTHPKMVRFRYDKSMHECIYTEQFLISQQV